jgi:hypothetical protein
MLGHFDDKGCCFRDRLVGFDLDLGPLGLTEEEVAEQLGLRTAGGACAPSVRRFPQDDVLPLLPAAATAVCRRGEGAAR